MLIEVLFTHKNKLWRTKVVTTTYAKFYLLGYSLDSQSAWFYVQTKSGPILSFFWQESDISLSLSSCSGFPGSVTSSLILFIRNNPLGIAIIKDSSNYQNK